MTIDDVIDAAMPMLFLFGLAACVGGTIATIIILIGQ
jgi:hypothetical protein